MPQPDKQPSGGAANTAPDREAMQRADQPTTAIASLRGVLRKSLDEAVKRGRMTRQDAEELIQNLVPIARRQSQDALAELEGLVGRSARETRRHARARVRSAGAVARRLGGGQDRHLS